MTRCEQVLGAFESALAATRSDPVLHVVHAALEQHRDAYLRRMGVAVVGRVSSGKSTLVNALLGGGYAPTGVEELTYHVSRLTYGPDSTLRVHFTDGRPAERRDPADLPALATRAGTDRWAHDYLAAIAHLEVTDPNAGLAAYDLIDTPGLDALDGGPQVARTLALLGRSSDSVRQDTITHAASADALIVVFPKAVSAKDAEIAARFVHAELGAGDPLTAVGALTKIEHYWGPQCADPMAEGRRNAARLMAVPEVRRVLFDVRPIAGKLAAAAAVFTADDYADLTELAVGAPDGAVRRLAWSAQLFTATGGTGLPLSGSRRGELSELFSPWGVATGCELLRPPAGAARPSIAELRGLLIDRSGLGGLKDLLSNHFARRAGLLKMRRAVDDATGRTAELATGLGARERDAVGRAVAPIGALANDPALRQLGVLRRYALGELHFTPNEAQTLLRITGEYGTDLAARLGAQPGAGAAELAVLAAGGHAHWSEAAVDPARAADREAVRTVLRAFDGLIHEVATTHGTGRG